MAYEERTRYSPELTKIFDTHPTLGAFVEGKYITVDLIDPDTIRISRDRDEGKKASTDLKIREIGNYKLSDLCAALGFVEPGSYDAKYLTLFISEKVEEEGRARGEYFESEKKSGPRRLVEGIFKKLFYKNDKKI